MPCPIPRRHEQALPRLARKILFTLAIAAVLVIGGYSAAGYWAKELSGFAFVPAKRFAPPPALPRDAYEDPAMWHAQGVGSPQDAARWSPRAAAAPADLPAAVFFLHPTSYFDRNFWNAPLDDARAQAQAQTYLRGLATPFAGAIEIWAPRYRQATFGAFLSDGPDGAKALDAAYGDVMASFDAFIAGIDPNRPIILAGHSQGAFHLLRLLRERVAGRPLARRIVAAYVVGWPVSIAQDLPALGLPACAAPDQSGCIIGWQSFAEPADTKTVREAYARFNGGREGTPYLCTNPLTGAPASSAPATANLGTLVPDLSLNGATLLPHMVPARCSPDGFLLIGQPPRMGPAVLPGNNYHIYDIPLFWANLRADAQRRTAHFLSKVAK
jgi:hypothetical protein